MCGFFQHGLVERSAVHCSSAKLGTLCALMFLLAATVTPAVLTIVDKLPPGMLARVDVSEVK